MSYSDFISINKNFQSSVNLELDLKKEIKIEEYVPTTDICDVIKKYVKTAIGESKDFATTLVGPYGKGKSFLLLVLTYLFGNNKKSATYEKLLKKIKKVDTELYDLLIKVQKNDIKLLPVIINSNYDNITQSFQLALNDALKREGCNDIVPSSVYDVCLKILEKWNSRKDLKESVLKKCIDVNGVDLKELENGLVNLSPVSYKQFESLYNCINIGLDFNPLVNNDVIKTYQNILMPINEKGYDGLFIIFDEFSKFLESNSSDLMKDLKIIQDFAELAARSNKKTQMHLCCVTHKSMSLYKNDKKNSNVLDAFKTVEGRFKEIRFNRSLNENYQLISSAFFRKENITSIISEYMHSNNDFVREMFNLEVFKDKFLQKVIFNECFPLNPLTVYSLVNICELVAQNERTLFTFLSDTDDDSFNSFIHSNSTGLFNVDKIFDYFSQLFKKEETNNIKNIWYRAESILSKLENSNEKKIIKVLSIILIINNFDEFSPTEKNISLATEIELKDVEIAINSLIDKHYIRKNAINNYISFALSSSKQIDEAIQILKNTKCKNIKFSEIADEINEKKYLLPRRYNEENKITRFYKTLFLSEEDLNNISSFNYYFERNYCDGVVIYLLNEKLNTEQINEKVHAINDPRVLVKIPKENIKKVFYDSLTNYACLTEYKKQKGIDEITQNQVSLIQEELKLDVQTLINNYFENDFDYLCSDNLNEESFSELLSKIMDKNYSFKLIFNNELMNKKVVTTQYQKAINNVIDWIINDQKPFNYSETSPESSIKYAILDNNDVKNNKVETSNNFRKVIEKIKNKLISSDGDKIIIENALKPFSLMPFGIRDGVMPIIFAKAISELSDNAIIYYKNKEVELNATNIVKAIKNDNYQISFAKGSIEQKDFLNKMLDLFEVSKEDNFRKDVFLLAKSIKNFFIGMPQIVRLCNKTNNTILLDDKFISFKSLFMTFDINPYEVIFIKSFEVFNVESYDEVYKNIEEIVDNKDNLLSNYFMKLISIIKKIFSIDEKTSLKSGFDNYINANVKKDEKPILEDSEKKLFNLIKLGLSYDDNECVEKISKVITNQYIEDWDNDKSSILKDKLEKFKISINSYEKISNSTLSMDQLLKESKEIDGVSTLLKNNIESVLEEFSGSITSKDKIDVLISILKDLI